MPDQEGTESVDQSKPVDSGTLENIMQNFSIADLAQEHVRSLIMNHDPAAALKTLCDAFDSTNKINTASMLYCAVYNESGDDVIEAEDFECRLADAVEAECERQLSLLDVSQELIAAKQSLQDNAGWHDYAADVMSAIRGEATILKERELID